MATGLNYIQQVEHIIKAVQEAGEHWVKDYDRKLLEHWVAFAFKGSDELKVVIMNHEDYQKIRELLELVLPKESYHMICIVGKSVIESGDYVDPFGLDVVIEPRTDNPVFSYFTKEHLQKLGERENANQ